MKRENREIKYLKHRQLKKLFKSIEDTKDNNKYYLRDLTLFNIAYYCGMRISELGLIILENYNKDNGEIYIRRLKGSNNSTITLDKKRRLLLNKYIKKYKIKDDTEYLFKSKTGKAISKSTIEYLVNKYKRLSKISDFHFHMLKHSISVHLLELGIDIFDLKNYLGHKSIDSTMVYASFSSTMNKKIYKTIDNNLIN